MISSRSLWIIRIGSVVALILIVLPVVLYVYDFHDLKRSTNPSDWGTFGDFFGGILNPIISFLTLVVTIIIAINISRIESRNHEETVHNQIKPIFIIENTEFYSADVSRFNIPFGKNFYIYSQPENHAGQYDYMSHPFYLKIRNKGLGIAIKVQAIFTINLNELREKLQFENSEIKVVVSEIRLKDNGVRFITVNFNHEEYKSSFIIFEKETEWLGVVDMVEVTNLYIPRQMMTAFDLYNFLKNFKVTQNFPTLNISFQYENMHNKPLKSDYAVGLLHVGDKRTYSVYRIAYNQV